MSFNPDPSKSAVEVYFSQRSEVQNIPPLLFADSVVANQPFQKHLGLVLDSKLSFVRHLSEKVSKANKLIGVIKRLRTVLPRHVLLKIYKAFVIPHLDYGDILYDNPGNNHFVQRIESIQYNAALAITGCIRGTSREKLYSELGLESLFDRRYCRRLCFFYKIVNGYGPTYLSKYLPERRIISYAFRHRQPVESFRFRTERFRNSFFPFCLTQWNKLDCHIRDLPSLSAFKRALFSFFRTDTRSVFRATDHFGVVLLNRLRVGFSHLNEHRFRHNFLDITDPFCSCRTNAIEDTKHFLLHCPNYLNERTLFFNDLSNLSMSLLPYCSDTLCEILLYGSRSFSEADNHLIINSVVRYIVSSERFSGSIFN